VTSEATGSAGGVRFLLHEITRTGAAARAPEALLVLPVGATEQHGPHLPLGTDWLIVEHVARAAARQARDEIDVLVAPTMPFGASHHHLPFGGTVSLATDRYYGALRDMTESLIQSGFRRIFLLNGHGGNHELVQLVIRDLAQTFAVNLGAASYWDIAKPALEERGPVLHGLLPGHAGVFETSVIAALHPDLVADPLPHRDQAELARTRIPDTPFRAERHGFWQSTGGFTDSPDEASAALGRQLLDVVVPPIAAAFITFAQLPLLDGGGSDKGVHS